MFLENFVCKKCERNIGEAEEQYEKLINGLKAIRQFAYVGYMVSTDI